MLSADLFQLNDSLAALDKQQAQKQATLQRLKMSIAFQDNLMQTLTDRVSTRQQALDLNVGTKINLYDAKEELQKSQASLASDQGQLIETDAALKELESEKLKTVSGLHRRQREQARSTPPARATRRAKRSTRRRRGCSAPSSSRRSTATVQQTVGDDHRPGGDDRPGTRGRHAELGAAAG